MVEKWRTKWEEFSDNSWSERFCEHGSWRSFGDEGTVRELFWEIDGVFSEFWWDKNLREVVEIVLRENAVKWSSFFAWWWLEPWLFFSIFSRNSQLTPFFFRGVGPGRSTTNQIWVNIPWSSQQTPVHCSNHVLYDMKSYEIPFYMSKSEFQVCPSIWRSVLWSPVCVCFLFWCFPMTFIHDWFGVFCQLFCHDCSMIFRCCTLHVVWCFTYVFYIMSDVPNTHTISFEFPYLPIMFHGFSFSHVFFRLSMFFPLVVPPETFGTPGWAR